VNTDHNIQEKNRGELLKVLFVTHNYIRYKGDFAGVFLHLLARKLLEKNIQVYVVAPHDEGLPEEETIDGIKIYRFQYGDDDEETLAYRGNMHNQLMRNPFKVFRLRKFLKASHRTALKVIMENDIEMVSVHWLIPNVYVAHKLKKRLGDKIRLFISSHGTDIRLLHQYKFIYNLRFVRETVRSCRAYTVVSSFLRDQLVSLDKTIASKIHVVPLPNDESVFYPDKNIPEDRNLVVAVSRLTRQKRLDFLFRAVKKAADKLPSIKLEIYGNGPERENLQKLMADLGLEGRVKMFDPIPQKDLRRVYNRAAVVVLNSYQEGFGLALSEAMLCRTAVIGTKSGGIVDIIDDNETGLLVPVDDVKALAGVMARVLGDESLRGRLAEAGYREAMNRFSSKASAEAFSQLFIS
jgi:glycosyltransferase involved in cell wall biosynthesis